MLTLEVNKKVLEARLIELGLSAMDVARLFAALRTQREQKEWTAQQLYSTVRQALINPDTSSMKIVETLIEALDGELVVRWRTREQVISGERIVDMEGNEI